jgi:hypothetical protein
VSAQYFIAKNVQADSYVVLVGNKVVAGPFPSAAEAVKARDGLVKAGRVTADDISAERVAKT